VKGHRISIIALLAGLLTIPAAIAGCTTAPTGTTGTDWSSLYMVGIMVLLFVMFYFLMVRPVRQREKRRNQMLSQLQKGDTVITAGGIYGQVEKIDEASVVLKVESGATIRVTKSGILGKSGGN